MVASTMVEFCCSSWSVFHGTVVELLHKFHQVHDVCHVRKTAQLQVQLRKNDGVLLEVHSCALQLNSAVSKCRSEVF